MKDVIKFIHMDLERNRDLRNKQFIYIFRWGCYCHANRNRFFFRCADIVFRILIKMTVNKINHFPLEIRVGGGLRLPHRFGIVISGKAEIGENCTIMHQVTIGIDETKSERAPKIGNDVFIGARAKIIGDISIGNRVKIGANAVVTKDIADGCTVVGFNKVKQNL